MVKHMAQWMDAREEDKCSTEWYTFCETHVQNALTLWVPLHPLQKPQVEYRDPPKQDMLQTIQSHSNL